MIGISVVVTVKNDEEGVRLLLENLKKQTVRPDEVIIVRSEDYGNCTRGRGRNIGVRMAKNEFIAVTDVGCRPRRDWVEKITAGLNTPKESSFASWSASTPAKSDPSGFGRTSEFFQGKNTGLSEKVVVAGWYEAVAETPWQKAFLPYLVPRGFNKGRALKVQGQAFQTFLPASRSIAFTKSAWELVGGYPEEPVSGGEDLKFADKLCNHPGIKIIYSPKAVVDWPVPATLTEFIKDMVKHTKGNFEAGYWPHIVRNLSVVARWMAMVVWPWVIPGYLIFAGLNKGQAFEYKGLALQAKVIKNIKIIMIILLVRLIADAAVVYGTVIGIIDGWVIKKLRLRASDG